LRLPDERNTLGVVNTASFRLPPELLGALERSATRARRPKSEIVRAALEEYMARDAGESGLALSQLIDHLVTYEGSGVGDLATRGEAHLRARFHARRRRPR
jgi:hypothetical protein